MAYSSLQLDILLPLLGTGIVACFVWHLGPAVMHYWTEQQRLSEMHQLSRTQCPRPWHVWPLVTQIILLQCREIISLVFQTDGKDQLCQTTKLNKILYHKIFKFLYIVVVVGRKPCIFLLFFFYINHCYTDHSVCGFYANIYQWTGIKKSLWLNL